MPRRVPTRTQQNEERIRNLDEATVKAQLIQNLRDQRQAYLEGLAGEEQEAVPTEMEEDTWLDAEHVDIAIQSLVAERNHLKNSVGICPVFNADAAKQAAQNIAIDFMKTQPENERLFRVLPPLPSKAGLRGKALTDRNKEERRRNLLHKLINRRASDMVKQEGLDERFFFLHLEGVTENQALLGNPAKRNLPLKDCQQLIIPIRHHENHYTVAVVHFKKENRKRIANIKYYDSMGGDLDDDLKTQLVQFLNSKGYDPQYENYSFDDQREGYNCSIFASYGSIDLANLNAGNDENFLEEIDGLDEEAYKERLDGLRQNIMIKLMQRMNITLSPDYIKQIKEGSNKVQKDSRATQKREELNRKINTIREEIEDVLHRVKGTRPQARSKRKTDKKLAEIQPKELLAECTTLVKQLKANQERLNKKRTKTNQDKNNLRAISAVLKKYHDNFSSLQNQTRRQNVNQGGFFKDIKDWMSGFSLPGLAFYAALIGIGLFVTLPYLSYMVSLLPSHPILTVIATTLCFSGCYYVSQHGTGQFINENDAQQEAPTDDVEDTEEEDEELDEDQELQADLEEVEDETPEDEEELEEEDRELQELEAELETPRRRSYTPMQQARNSGRGHAKGRTQPQPTARRSQRRRA